MKNFIGYITDKNYNFDDIKQAYGMPSQYIVRRFQINNKYKKIKIRVACLGVYSLYTNGTLVNDYFMCQDCTEYTKTITYRDYDIKPYIKDGLNCIGFVVSDGWYSGSWCWNGRCTFGSYPNKIYYEIYGDGELLYLSDGSELASDGEIRGSDHQNGIIIDTNYNSGDFSSPNYDLSKFNKVSLYKVKAKLKKSIIPPTVCECRLKPTIIKQSENEVIFDFKQNLTGVVHAIFKGHKNDVVKIYHAEVLTDDGNDIYRENYRTALCEDTFILADDNKWEYLPRHVFRGFRYAKFVFDGKIDFKDVEAIHFWTKCKRRGVIKTNNKLVNKLYSNILWGQRDNFLSIPTDCPQRDERMGWTGDAQIFAQSAMFNYDVEKFLINFVHNMMDTMDIHSDGLPVVSPLALTRYPISIGIQGWSDAIIFIPYCLYLFYGNKKILREAYSYMERFLKYNLDNRVKDGLVDAWSFNDWLSVDDMCDLGIYNNSYYALEMYTMYEISKILNNNKQDEYFDKYQKIKKLTRQKFIDSNGVAKGDSQGAYVLLTASNVCTLNENKDHLLKAINKFDHLTTGFHSTKYVLGQLCDIGHKDIAYRFLNRKEYPSWGYMIECGATTIWERWDSYRKDVGFNDVGMNSFNHYSLGSVVEWMYKYMAGIRPTLANPAFKQTIVSPYFDKSVSKCKCSMMTKNGKISIKYSICDDIIEYHIKGNQKIQFDFKFNNQIIAKEEIGKNDFIFKLKY